MKMTHYFSPGPSTLPKPVLKRLHDELFDTFGIGVSIMEISHRSKYYAEVNQQTLELVRKVFAVPKSHSVLLTPFGAQQHFSLIVENLARRDDMISYAETGWWASLSCREAKISNRKFNLVYTGAPEFRKISSPEAWDVPQNSTYMHLTINNTIYGTEFSQIPTYGSVPLILDMTSALGARTDLPWEHVGLIYASAQKNFGIAGVSVVIIRNDLLEQSKHITEANHLGTALSYHAIHAADSILNTPPVFPIFAMNRTLQWIEAEGGVPEMEKRAKKKANMIYERLDGDFYQGWPDPACRSRHNFVFKLPTPEQDNHFIEEARKENLLEIKGYKNTQGIRVSAYNGVTLESMRKLCEFMDEYKRKYG